MKYVGVLNVRVCIVSEAQFFTCARTSIQRLYFRALFVRSKEELFSMRTNNISLPYELHCKEVRETQWKCIGHFRSLKVCKEWARIVKRNWPSDRLSIIHFSMSACKSQTTCRSNQKKAMQVTTESFTSDGNFVRGARSKAKSQPGPRRL